MSEYRSMRLKDVIANHHARFAGLSQEADLAMQRLAFRVAHRADALVQSLGEYREYRQTIRSLDLTAA